MLGFLKNQNKPVKLATLDFLKTFSTKLYY